MRLRATQLVACALAAVLVATLLHAQRAVERVERVYGAAGPGPRRPSAPLAVPVQPRRPSAPPAIPVHAAHTPRGDRSPCRGPRSYAQTASLPWRLYDAFTTTADGCATATFVAQYERGCEEMAAVLEAAAAPLNASAWLATARAPEGECRVCYVNRFDTDERPKFDAEKKRAFERNGGATTDLACVFDDGSEVPATGHGDFHAFRSTLVFECAIPEPLRARACGADALRHRDTGVHVALRAGGRAHDGRVPVCAFDARARERGGVGAVAWTSGDAYVDRSGLVKGAASDAQLRAWLAAHWAFGVRYFLVFDSGAEWTEPERSALWPAMAPFVAAGRGALLPWPSRACGARGDGPWVTLDAGEHDALSLQSFWGRPSQYAAQNAGHRRLRGVVDFVAHVDVDEYLVPAGDHADLSSAVDAALRRRPAAPSVGAPHVFYGACPGAGVAHPAISHVADRGCAGKAQPTRTKQVARATETSYVWDHYIRAPKRPVADADAFDDLKLVHARAGYGFSEGAAPARFSARHNARAEREYATTILPRVPLPCADRRADATAPPCAPKAAPGYGLCWCADGHLAGWLARVAAAERAWWPP